MSAPSRRRVGSSSKVPLPATRFVAWDKKVRQMTAKLPKTLSLFHTHNRWVLLLALVPAALAPAQAEEPSLAETLAWMDSTYNPHERSGGGFGHGREEIFSEGKPFKRRFSFFTHENCTITLSNQDDPTAPLYSDLYTSAVYNFNLRDIDPASIKIYRYDAQAGGLSCDVDSQHMICDVAEIEFETRNQTPLIKENLHIVWPKLQGSEHEAHNNKPTFVATFYVDNSEYADRFAKAFRHAVALCGGKASPF